MKKTGFTLAELVITLTIIAIAAALVLPFVVNLVPDKNKIKIMHVYSELSAATETILNPGNQHYIEVDVEGTTVDGDTYGDGVPDCIGLACTDKSADIDDCEFEKYACYLQKYIGGEFNTAGELVLTDGVKLTVEEKKNSENEISHHGIIVNLGTGGSCVYGENGCKDPDSFKIRVENDGSFSPCDPLLDAYLRDAMNTHNKKENFNTAETLKANNIYNFDYIEIDVIK